jgi:hypothetical protein
VEMSTFSTVALTRSLCCRPKPRVRFDEMGVEEGGSKMVPCALCLRLHDDDDGDKTDVYW